jgi:hypothetical protein
MYTQNVERHFPTSPELQTTEHVLEGMGSATLSFVELVLYASDYSEDQVEIGDLVDALFDCDQISLTKLNEEQIPWA